MSSPARLCTWRHVGGYKSAATGQRAAGIYRCDGCGRLTSASEQAETERQCREEQAKDTP